MWLVGHTFRLPVVRKARQDRCIPDPEPSGGKPRVRAAYDRFIPTCTASGGAERPAGGPK